jgi:hypothetical protein
LSYGACCPERKGTRETSHLIFRNGVLTQKKLEGMKVWMNLLSCLNS